jgi:DNA-binding SARP family transcriptional activator
MDFRLLGPLTVADDDRELTLGGGKQRALLALLLTHPNEALSSDRLIDELWGAEAPPTAAKMLQNYVSGLRRALGANGGGTALETRGSGYLLRVRPGERDLDRFEELLERGRAGVAQDPETAAKVLREALALWRGPPLSEFAYEQFAQEEIARLEELRLDAIEERIEADLAVGRDAELVAELGRLVKAHPFRERLRAQLMLALYRCGRQADALASYRDARRTLAEELGLEPGRELRELERAILAQDEKLQAPRATRARRRRLRSARFGNRGRADRPLRRPRSGVVPPTTAELRGTDRSADGRNRRPGPRAGRAGAPSSRRQRGLGRWRPLPHDIEDRSQDPCGRPGCGSGHLPDRPRNRRRRGVGRRRGERPPTQDQPRLWLGRKEGHPR